MVVVKYFIIHDILNKKIYFLKFYDIILMEYYFQYVEKSKKKFGCKISSKFKNSNRY